jgi:hypothetical protein
MATTKNDAKATPPANKGQRANGSISDRIERLKVGESMSEAHRLALDGLTDGADLVEQLHRVRTNQASYVGRVKSANPAREFKTESGTFVSDGKDALLVCVVTTRMR